MVAILDTGFQNYIVNVITVLVLIGATLLGGIVFDIFNKVKPSMVKGWRILVNTWYLWLIVLTTPLMIVYYKSDYNFHHFDQTTSSSIFCDERELHYLTPTTNLSTYQDHVSVGYSKDFIGVYVDDGTTIVEGSYYFNDKEGEIISKYLLFAAMDKEPLTLLTGTGDVFNVHFFADTSVVERCVNANTLILKYPFLKNIH